VALLCTGELQPFRTSGLLLEPQKLLHHFVAGVAGGRRLGVVVPVREQIAQGETRERRALEFLEENDMAVLGLREGDQLLELPASFDQPA
jgi:protein AroM